MAYKGKFTPINKEKYVGDINNIVYRSLWELKFLRTLDSDPNVIQYSSEELVIPYVSPVDGKPHRYFVDFLVKTKSTKGKIKIQAIEVKPDSQTRPPDIGNKFKTKTGKVSRRYLNEAKTYAINTAKWEAAHKYCKERGWEFKVATEYDLGIKKAPRKKKDV